MLTETQKDKAYQLVSEVQATLISRLEAIDGQTRAVPHHWRKHPSGAGGAQVWSCAAR